MEEYHVVLHVVRAVEVELETRGPVAARAGPVALEEELGQVIVVGPVWLVG
jgi:hypothetical protein